MWGGTPAANGTQLDDIEVNDVKETLLQNDDKLRDDKLNGVN